MKATLYAGVEKRFERDERSSILTNKVVRSFNPNTQKEGSADFTYLNTDELHEIDQMRQYSGAVVSAMNVIETTMSSSPVVITLADKAIDVGAPLLKCIKKFMKDLLSMYYYTGLCIFEITAHEHGFMYPRVPTGDFKIAFLHDKETGNVEYYAVNAESDAVIEEIFIFPSDCRDEPSRDGSIRSRLARLFAHYASLAKTYRLTLGIIEDRANKFVATYSEENRVETKVIDDLAMDGPPDSETTKEEWMDAMKFNRAIDAEKMSEEVSNNNKNVEEMVSNRKAMRKRKYADEDDNDDSWAHRGKKHIRLNGESMFDSENVAPILFPITGGRKLMHLPSASLDFRPEDALMMIRKTVYEFLGVPLALHSDNHGSMGAEEKNRRRHMDMEPAIKKLHSNLVNDIGMCTGVLVDILNEITGYNAAVSEAERVYEKTEYIEEKEEMECSAVDVESDYANGAEKDSATDICLSLEGLLGQRHKYTGFDVKIVLDENPDIELVKLALDNNVINEKMFNEILARLIGVVAQGANEDEDEEKTNCKKEEKDASTSHNSGDADRGNGAEVKNVGEG